MRRAVPGRKTISPSSTTPSSVIPRFSSQRRTAAAVAQSNSVSISMAPSAS
jgi:hypothetical protein